MNTLLVQALKLPATKKINLIDALLDSFNASKKNKAIESAWKEEIERREEAFKKGLINTIDADEVFKELRNEG